VNDLIHEHASTEFFYTTAESPFSIFVISWCA